MEMKYSISLRRKRNGWRYPKDLQSVGTLRTPLELLTENMCILGAHPKLDLCITIINNFHSILLLAVVDYAYKFIFTDIGNGSVSDTTVFNECGLPQAMNANTIALPEPKPLPHDDHPLLFFMIGDDAFALRTWLMKPFPSRSVSIPQSLQLQVVQGKKSFRKCFWHFSP